jgi:hypothetical protein
MTYFENVEEKCSIDHAVITTLALLRIWIIWDVMPCQQVIGSRYFKGTAARVLKGRHHAPWKHWEPVTQ